MISAKNLFFMRIFLSIAFPFQSFNISSSWSILLTLREREKKRKMWMEWKSIIVKILENHWNSCGASQFSPPPYTRTQTYYYTNINTLLMMILRCYDEKIKLLNASRKRMIKKPRLRCCEWKKCGCEWEKQLIVLTLQCSTFICVITSLLKTSHKRRQKVYSALYEKFIYAAKTLECFFFWNCLIRKFILTSMKCAAAGSSNTACLTAITQRWINWTTLFLLCKT